MCINRLTSAHVDGNRHVVAVVAVVVAVGGGGVLIPPIHLLDSGNKINVHK